MMSQVGRPGRSQRASKSVKVSHTRKSAVPAIASSERVRPHALDEIDRAALALIAKDARLSMRALGRKLGMSPGAMSERIDRLERAGVIHGYHAHIDHAALGFGAIEIIIGVRTQQGPILEQALEDLLAVPEVESALVVTGEWDLIVFLRVQDHEHLRQLILSRIWKIPGFSHSETMMVLDRYAGPADPFAECTDIQESVGNGSSHE